MRKRYKRKNATVYLAFTTIIIAISLTVFSSYYQENWLFDWRNIRKEIKDSIRVAEFEGIDSGFVGDNSRKSPAHQRCRWIMKHSTVEELLLLTGYPSGIIKTIAYEGLIRKKKYHDKTNLILKAVCDTVYKIEYQSGCVGVYLDIGEYLVDFVLYIDDEAPPAPLGYENRFNLTESDIAIILGEYRSCNK